jgi:RNA polymerase sigma factor (sigma-70 family)
LARTYFAEGTGPENFRSRVKLFRPGEATVRTWTAARATRRCFSPSPNATWGPSARCTSATPAGSRSGLTRRCNDRDLVADAIGDTFVAVWQKPRGFRGDGDIAAWLWGIAIRRLVSRLRTRSSVAAVFEHPGAAPAAEDQVLLSVEYCDMGQALTRLSPEMRAVIQAVVLDGLSAKEAAQLLHVPVSSVKTRLYRAKAHLRAALAEGSS